MGRRVPRREDPALLSDAGKYTSDIHLPGALHMVVVLTPYTYGTIRHVDTNAARALDGLVAVLTAPDVNPHVAHPFPNMRMLDRYSVRQAPQRYPLAAGRVRHVGDPVAILLAHNRYVAAGAADLLFVDYDPLPVLVDPEAALSADAPLLYEEWGSNVGFCWQRANADVERLFAQAAHVVQCRVANQRVIGNALEPRAVSPANTAFPP